MLEGNILDCVMASDEGRPGVVRPIRVTHHVYKATSETLRFFVSPAIQSDRFGVCPTSPKGEASKRFEGVG